MGLAEEGEAGIATLFRCGLTTAKPNAVDRTATPLMKTPEYYLVEHDTMCRMVAWRNGWGGRVWVVENTTAARQSSAAVFGHGQILV